VTAERFPAGLPDLADPADLFAVLYDRLTADTLLFNREASSWADQQGFEDVAFWAERMAFGEGRVDLTRLRLTAPLRDSPGTLAILIGIDRALACVNPRLGGVDTGALGYVLRRYARTGRFSTGNVPGAVLPKLTQPARPEGQLTAADTFTSVVRVPDHSWRAVNHERADARQDLPRLTRDLNVVVAPLLDSPRDIDITRIRGARRNISTGEAVDGYVLRPDDREEIRTRIRGILGRITEEKADIGVLPEASLSAPLLAYWRDQLRRLSQDPDVGPRCCWILVGTGPVGEPDPEGRYPNRAVVLDQFGEQVFSQDKTRDFSLTPKLIDDWELSGPLGGTDLAVEWISRGDRIEVRESQAGRFAILICEDITGSTWKSVLEDCGVSHLLVPIFAAPLRGDWEFPRSDAQDYVRQAGSWVLAVNSLVTDSARESYIGLLVGPCPTSRGEWGEASLKFIEHSGPHRTGTVTLPTEVDAKG